MDDRALLDRPRQGNGASPVPDPARTGTSARTGDLETRDIAVIVNTLTEDASELISTQVRLAIVEARDEVKASVAAGKYFAGFGACIYMAVVLGSFAAAWGLAVVMPAGFAFLIVALLYASVGAFLFRRGRAAAEAIEIPPPETTKSIEEDVAWLRQQRS